MYYLWIEQMVPLQYLGDCDVGSNKLNISKLNDMFL